MSGPARADLPDTIISVRAFLLRLVRADQRWEIASLRNGMPAERRPSRLCREGRRASRFGHHHGAREVQGEESMSKILSTGIIAGLLLGATAAAFAADAPKTKAECDKLKDMKWDDAKKVCVKK